MDECEVRLSPHGSFVVRMERRIRRCQLQAKLAEAKACVTASRVKKARKGRNRRRGGG
jgi:hypothetical protein